MSDERLERWIDALIATPGLTAIRDREQAWAVHVDGSLRATDVVRAFEGEIVDVGSGGGAPGIPLAAAFPGRRVTLLEANARKCAFLRDASRDFPNVRVVNGRAEEQPLEEYAVAVAKALAHPPVAAEWCLPLVHTGGGAVLYVGPTVDRNALARVAEHLAAAPPELVDGLAVLRKTGPTPPGFPRRTGIARKRPLA